MFTFHLSPAELFEERRRQFIAWGIPKSIVAGVEERSIDMWANMPGGWTYEWVQEAEKARSAGNWMLAASLFGAARFPCLATPARRAALDEQAHCFVKAARGFAAHFDRQVIPCDVNGEAVKVPVHVYVPKGKSDLPTVLLSGGVDTGKMELHRLALLLSLIGKLRVVAMDMPGTGETNTPLTQDAEVIYRAVLAAVRGKGKIGMFGVSFGGHWTAKLALRREVDVAVNFGGPIGVMSAQRSSVANLPNGMSAIIGNAMRLDAVPDESISNSLLSRFSLDEQGLLNRPDCARMLAVNGSADQYLPSADVEVFRRYPSAEVWLLRGLSHCAAEKIMRVTPGVITWLRKELHGASFGNRLRHRMALTLRPETC